MLNALTSIGESIMASNKKEDIDFDNWDDFNFDEEFSLDSEGGFESDESPRGRNPITRLAGSFVDGIKDAIFRRETASKIVGNTLPKNYQIAFDSSVDTVNDARFLSWDLQKAASKNINEFKKDNQEAFDEFAKQLPQGAGTKLTNWANKIKQEGGGYSPGDQLDLDVNSHLTGIFGEQIQAAHAEQQTEMATKTAISSEQQTGVMVQGNQILHGIARDTNRLATYQDKVGVNFQRKMLEVQMQHLLVSRKHLELVQQKSEFYEKSLETLIHNTGLPDAVKVNGYELLQQEWAKNFWGEMSAPVLSQLAPLRAKILAHSKKRIVEGLSEASSVAGMAVQPLLSMGGGDLAGDKSLTEQIAAHAGGYATNKAIDYTTKYIKNKIKETGGYDGRIEDGDKVLQWIRAFAPQYIQDNVLRGNTGNSVVDSISGLLGLSELSQKRNTKIMDNQEDILDKGAVFDYRTRNTITEVIPGLLARIHQEIYKQNGGKLDSPLKFDWKKHTWSTEEDLAVSYVNDYVGTQDRYQQVTKYGEDILKAIDPNNELSEKNRNHIVKKAMMSGINNKGLSLADFLSSSADDYDEDLDKFLRNKLNISPTATMGTGSIEDMVKFRRDAGIKYLETETAFLTTRNSMANQFRDPKRDIVEYLKRGYSPHELKRHFNWITVNKSGQWDIDYEKYYDWLMVKGRKDDIDAKIEQAKKDQELKENIDRIANGEDTTTSTTITTATPTAETVTPVTNGIFRNHTPYQYTTSDGLGNASASSSNIPMSFNTESNSKWNKVKNKLKIGAIGAGGMLFPTVAGAALPGVAMVDGTPVSLLIGGTVAAAGLGGVVFARNRQNNQQEEVAENVDGTTGEGVANQQLPGNPVQAPSHKYKVSTGTNASTVANIPVTDRVETLLNLIHDTIKEQSPKPEAAKANEQLDAIFNALSTGIGIAPPLAKGLFGKLKSGAGKVFGLGWKTGKSTIKTGYEIGKGVLKGLFGGPATFIENRIKNLKSLSDAGFNFLFGKDDKKGVVPTVVDTAGSLATGLLSTGRGLVGGGVGIARKIAGNIRGRLADIMNTDLYVPGFPDPKIYLSKLKAGHYRDQVTGKVITKLNDIKGAVIDENGNVVLTVDDIKAGLYDKSGKRIDSVIGLGSDLLGSTISKGIDLGAGLVKFGWNVAKVGWNVIIGVGRGLLSMFGSDKLKLKLEQWKKDGNWAHLFSFGNFSVASKQLDELIVIRKLLESKLKPAAFNDHDKDGDRDGGVIDILTNRKKAKDEVKEDDGEVKEEKEVKKEKKGIFHHIADFLKTGIMQIAKFAIPAGVGGLILEYFLDDAAGKGPKKDKQGNIIADNDPRLDPKSPMFDKELYEHNQPSMFQRGFNWVNEQTKDWSTTSKALGLAGAGYLGLKAALKTPGLLAKGAWNLSKWGITRAAPLVATKAAPLVATKAAPLVATKAAPLVATKAAGALGLAARGAGVLGMAKAGAATIGSLLVGAAPFILGAVVVGAAAYGAYKLYRRYKGDNHPYNFMRLRMAGYGYDFDDEKYGSKLLALEETLLPYIKFNSSGIAVLSDSVMQSMVIEPFGVNSNNPEDFEKWRRYFLFRFLPVFISHVTICKQYTGGTDLMKMDTDLRSINAEQAAQATLITASENNAYDVMESGFYDQDEVDFDRDDVYDIYKTVSSKMQEETKTGKNAVELQKEKEAAKQAHLTNRQGGPSTSPSGSSSNGTGSTSSDKKLSVNNIDTSSKSTSSSGSNKSSSNDKSVDSVRDSSNGSLYGWIKGLFGGDDDKKEKSAKGPDSDVASGLLGGYLRSPKLNDSGGGLLGDGIQSSDVKISNDVVDFARKFTRGLRIGNLTEAQTAALAANTAETESRFRMGVINKYGYSGLYQFGGSALADIGYMRKIPGASWKSYNAAMRNPANWLNGLSLQKFLASKELQDRAYILLANKNIAYGRGAARGDSARFDQMISDYRVLAKYLKMAHLKGAGNAVKGLLYGRDAEDGTGTSMIKYGNGAANKVAGILKAMGQSAPAMSAADVKSKVQNAIGAPTNSTETYAGAKKSGSKSAASKQAAKMMKTDTGGGGMISGVLANQANNKAKEKVPGQGVLKTDAYETKVQGTIVIPTDNGKDSVTSTSSGRAIKAADYATKNAAPKSLGRCARYVRVALEHAGYKLTPQPSAYEYWTNGIMEKMGFQKIAKNTQLQVGDVVVFNRTPKHPHGHIAIWNGAQWVSDFKQNKFFVSTEYSKHNDYQLFRDPTTKISGESGASYTAGDIMGGAGMAASAAPAFKPSKIGGAVGDRKGSDKIDLDGSDWRVSTKMNDHITKNNGKDFTVHASVSKKPATKVKSDELEKLKKGVLTPAKKDIVARGAESVLSSGVTKYEPVTSSKTTTKKESSKTSQSSKQTTSGTTSSTSKSVPTITTNVGNRTTEVAKGTQSAKATTPITQTPVKTIKQVEKVEKAKVSVMEMQVSQMSSVLKSQLQTQNNILQEIKSFRKDVLQAMNQPVKESADKQQPVASSKTLQTKKGPNEIREPVSLIK